MQGNLHQLGEPDLVKRVVDPIHRLTVDELDSTSLSALRSALEQLDRVAGLTLELGGQDPVLIGELPYNEQFREDLLRVYDSWLAQRISGGDTASISAHVPLLRAAAVALEWSANPQRVQETPLTAWLNLLVIMTPRSWTRREQSQLDGPTRRAVKPNAPERGRNVKAHDLRAQIAGVTTGLEAIRKVENVVVESRAVWERSQPITITIADDATDVRDADHDGVEPADPSRPHRPVAPPRPPLEAAEVRAQLAQRLDNIVGIPAGTRTTISKLINGSGEMNEMYENLGAVVETEDPDLCAEIQAVETAILYDLPPAPDPTKPERPPLITTIGLGDLVVARERLVGYEAHEIAHVENVLPGETKRVENERLHRYETTTEDETTTENESQTDTDTTDRDATQSQTQSDLSKSLAVDAGVNVSSKYGTTKIDASLDVQFQRSLSESKSETTDSVNEVITRTMEREREVVRNLRRTVTFDETRSLSRHKIDNTTDGTGSSPEPISGVYRWVEKVQEIELRRYGTRLMVEFHIPEPAVSILESQQFSEAQPVRTLPKFDVRARDLSRQTFMCLAQRYGAVLDPPPPEWVDVPYHHAAEVNAGKDDKGKIAHTDLISVPSEYRPVSVTVTVTGPPRVTWDDSPRPYITVAVGTATQRYVIVKDDEVTDQFTGPAIVSLWPDQKALGFVTTKAYFDPSRPVEQGVPISLNATHVDDNAFTAHAVIAAKLTDQAWQAWQLDSWDQLRQAHARKQDDLERREREQQINESFGIETTERPSSINRRTERTELKKWAIKAMRHETFDFHPMVTEDGLQEIDPSDSHAQAPVTAFFEESFEWSQMTYFFYPYYWARRDTWQLRQQQRSVDHTHEAFLQSGAARVIVPVTPGYERRLLCYLNFDDSVVADQIPGMDVPCPTDPITDDTDAATPDFHDIGLDILTQRHGDLVRGSGTLNVIQGNPQITINDDSLWAAGLEDVGRELQIDGADYEIINAPSPTTLVLDRPIETEDNTEIAYAAGSLRYSSPWQIRVPTNLLVLVEEALE
jgi:hypothetical protein